MEPNTQTPQDLQPPQPAPTQTTTPTTMPQQSVPTYAPAQVPSTTGTFAPGQAPISDAAAKKIKNGASSVFWFGVFLTVVLALVEVAASNVKTTNKSALLIITGLEVLLGIGMIVSGHRLKKLTADRIKALAGMNTAIALCGGVLVLSVIASVLNKPVRLPLQGLLALVAVVYLVIIRMQLKKLP